MRRTFLALAVLLVVAWLVGPQTAAAQGFGIYEHGSCSMAMAGAGVAAPCNDGSAIFFNPAGLAMNRDKVISFGGTLIGPRGDFINDVTGNVGSLTESWLPVPAFYAAFPMGDRTTLGIGLFAPYGLTTEWDDPDTWEGRFLAYKTSFASAYIQPTIAFKLSDKVALGAGVDINYASLELNQRIDLSTQQVPGAPAGVTFAALGVQRGTDFADIHIEGDNIKWGAHFGIIVKPTEQFSIGARYLTRQKIDVTEGEFTSEQIGTGFRLPVSLGPFPAGTPVDPILATQFQEGALLGPQGGKTDVTLPDQLVIGIAIMPSPGFKFAFDYQWVNWSLFDELVIELENGLTSEYTENYNNTSGLRFGVEFMLSEATALRGGYLYHQAAAPDETVTPLLPEAERNEITVGLGQRLGSSFTLDLAYQYIKQSDRAGRTVPEGQPNNGVYKFNANLFGLTLGWRF